MDISKRPISPSNALTPKPDANIKQQATISSLQDLKLEAGKAYSATVLTSKTPAPNDASSSKGTSTGKEYLAQIKSQTILISSDKPLENGQKLILKLDPASTLEKPSLIVQLLNTPKASANSNTPLDKNVITPLLQALNTTLDKQIPMQQGFNELNALLAALSGKNAQNSNEHLANTIKHIILDKLPKTDQILQTNLLSTSTNPTSAAYLKQSLSDSGLFFEKRLLTTPTLITAFKDQLNVLHQTANQPSLAPSSPNPSHTLARDKIQQTIEALLQLASSSLSKSGADKLNNEAVVTLNDLKASLLSTSALLIRELSQTLSDSELQRIFLAQIQDSPIVSPFAFPILNNTRLNQQTALSDSPELSAGQLLKLLAGMLHKLQFNQLSSLLQSNTSGESALQQTWFFELPLLNPNQSVQTFNFRLDKEPKDSNHDSETDNNALQWRLLLSFDLEPLGPIYVQVTLSENTITPLLWADHQDTLDLLEKESIHFKRQLEGIGLNVSDIFCQKGQPSTKKAQLDRHLVDTKA